MSLEHGPQRQKRGQRKQHAIARVCYSPEEFSQASGISRPTIYRMMADGRLRYSQVTPDMRKIPASEFARLGLTGEE
jgi:hypothetical protein